MAALGGVIQVPTIDGKAYELKIPPGTQSGELIRVRNMGLPKLNTGRRGYLEVRVVVETPRRLTKEHRVLLRKLAQIEQENVSERRKGFIEKVKEYIYGADSSALAGE